MSLPIHVVVPTIPARRTFLYERCLPAILNENPKKVVVVPGPHGAQRARNAGVKDAEEPYLIFVDDDVVLHAGALRRMLRELSGAPSDVGYVYCDYRIECHGTYQHPAGDRLQSQEFSARELRNGNFVPMCSLMRREIFPGFDEKLKRLQDWDLWLSILENGYVGRYIPEALFTAHFLEDGSITERESMAEAHLCIRRKHDLPGAHPI